MDWKKPAEQALDSFPRSYAESRAAFLRAAQARGAEVMSFPVDGTTPDGAPLSVDAAWIGPITADSVLVLLSGTHGVEGYPGAAAQVDVLENLAETSGVALLLVHALTPWGFAWQERTDETGVDLNRNFVDHADPPVNAGYAELAEFLVPADMSEQGMRMAEENIAKWKAHHGAAAFDKVRRAGQYTHPSGLYFGGQKAAPGNVILGQLFARYALAQRNVAVVDWHTGLGPFGHGELQSELPRDHRLFRLAEGIFGPELTSPFDGSSSSTVLNGTVQEGLFKFMAARDHIYVCLEFGTFPNAEARKVLLGLARRQDGARQASRAFFFPDTPGWNEMVLWRGRQVIRRLIEHFAKSGGAA